MSTKQAMGERERRMDNAVVRYMEFQGYTLEERGFDGFDYVFSSDADIVFVRVGMNTDGFFQTVRPATHEEFEHAIANWFKTHDTGTKLVSHDIITIGAVLEGRALLRHNRHVL